MRTFWGVCPKVRTKLRRIRVYEAKVMPNKHEQFSIAVLDDYQGVALSMADWSVLEGRVSVTVFNDHIADIDAVVSRLLPFDIVCVMRERTPKASHSSEPKKIHTIIIRSDGSEQTDNSAAAVAHSATSARAPGTR